MSQRERLLNWMLAGKPECYVNHLEQQVRDLQHQVIGLDAQLAAIEAKHRQTRSDFVRQFDQHSITISILEEREQQVADLQAKCDELLIAAKSTIRENLRNGYAMAEVKAWRKAYRGHHFDGKQIVKSRGAQCVDS